MTILSLDPAACALLGIGSKPLIEFCKSGKVSSAKDRPVPRINLRKRSSPEAFEASDFTIPQVTSAFLSSLFYEVNHDSERLSNENAQPPKKARMTPTRSCKSVCRNLGTMDRQSCSPTTTNTGFFDQENDAPKDVSWDGNQASCISSSSQDPVDVNGLTFPGLPPTVSDPSCSQPTLNFETDQQLSVNENSSEDDKETYGWFVVVDDEEDILYKPTTEAMAETPKDLAFRAPLPPMPTVYDDVKWAQAADTIDDVLADFF